jgi:hypothetical protein
MSLKEFDAPTPNSLCFTNHFDKHKDYFVAIDQSDEAK